MRCWQTRKKEQPLDHWLQFRKDGSWKLVEQQIFAAAAEKVRVFGIELLDIRFKRINHSESIRPKIYDRMISERRQIAERFLSERNGEAARIRGNRVRDLNKRNQ